MMAFWWHVVLFIDENRVEVVPKSWVINNDLCYWPTTVKNNSGILPLIKNCSVPIKETWKIVKIRIMGEKNKAYDDYMQASKAASKACYKSDISSSESEVPKKKLLNSSKGRTIKKNKKYYSTSDEDEQQNYRSDSSLTSVPEQKEVEEHSDQENHCGNLEVYDLEIQQNSDNSKPGKPNNNKVTGNAQRNDLVVLQNKNDTKWPSSKKDMVDDGSVMPNKDDNKDINGQSNNCVEILQKLCSRVAYLTLIIKGAVKDINTIKIKLENMEGACHHEEALPVVEEDTYKFPFDSYEAFLEFDHNLTTQKESYIKIVKFMSRIGGETPYDFVKRIMSRVMTDELSSQFSFTGHKGKKPFKGFTFINALQEAANNVRSLNKTTEKEIEQKLKDYLRHAPARRDKDQNRNNRNNEGNIE